MWDFGKRTLTALWCSNRWKTDRWAYMPSCWLSSSATRGCSFSSVKDHGPAKWVLQKIFIPHSLSFLGMNTRVVRLSYTSPGLPVLLLGWVFSFTDFPFLFVTFWAGLQVPSRTNSLQWKIFYHLRCELQDEFNSVILYLRWINHQPPLSCLVMVDWSRSEDQMPD